MLNVTTYIVLLLFVTISGKIPKIHVIEMETFDFEVSDEDKAMEKGDWIYSDENEVICK